MSESMDRPQLDKDARDRLSGFLVSEIGCKVIDGITYALLLKNNSGDAESIELYKKLRDDILNLGYTGDQIFRCYEIGNGYIFDIDLDIAKAITTRIAKAVANTDPRIADGVQLIGSSPEKRRKADLQALATYIVKQYETGQDNVEVALFSRNSTSRITISGKLESGEMVQIVYNAYALRHLDIEILNEKLLIPKGLRVAKLQLCEVLPSRTGVSCILTLESVE